MRDALILLLVEFFKTKLRFSLAVIILVIRAFYFQQTTGLFRVCILRSSKSCQP